MREDDIRERGIVNPITGITEGKLKEQIRSALRKIWRDTSRKEFIRHNRIALNDGGRSKWALRCEHCGLVMKQSSKSLRVLRSGKESKKAMVEYEIDHIQSNPPLIDIEKDLGNYAHNLFKAKLRILCYKCHDKVTHAIQEINEGRCLGTDEPK